LGQTDSENKKE